MFNIIKQILNKDKPKVGSRWKLIHPLDITCINGNTYKAKQNTTLVVLNKSSMYLYCVSVVLDNGIFADIPLELWHKGKNIFVKI